MLNDADASGFKKIYLVTGFTDLRRGIDGLATIIRFQFQLDPYDKNTLFLFCGKRSDLGFNDCVYRILGIWNINNNKIDIAYLKKSSVQSKYG